MYFTSRSVKLLAIGAAAALHSGPRQRETVYAFMQRAAEYGAKFYACPQALDEHGIAQADFIPEVTGVAGAAAFLGRCMDDLGSRLERHEIRHCKLLGKTWARH